jgi:hypothetical protein
LTFVGLQRDGKRHGGCVGAAAADRGDVAVSVDALKSRHDGHYAFVKRRVQSLCLDVLDSRAAVHAGGQNTYLRAGERTRGDATLIECHGKQRNRNLLARR